MSVRAFFRGIGRSVGGKSFRKAARAHREPGRRALSVEALEARSLLSASLRLSGASAAAGSEALADLPIAAQQAISSTIGQEAKLTVSDGVADGLFGSSVAISGNTVVVGAPGMVGNYMAGPGSAYVFAESASRWTEVATLTASDGAAGDGFGCSVAISGSTVVVGAPNAAVGSNGSQGAVYVFTESKSGWANMTQTARLTASDGVTSDGLGSSVGISGNTVVAGAPGAAVGGNLLRGAVYLFTKPGSRWANMAQTAKLTAPNESPYPVSAARFRSAAARWWPGR